MATRQSYCGLVSIVTGGSFRIDGRWLDGGDHATARHRWCAAGAVRGLLVEIDDAPGAGVSRIFTVVVDGVDTLSVTIEGTARQGTISGSSVFAAGAKISVDHSSLGGSPASTTGRITVVVDYADDSVACYGGGGLISGIGDRNTGAFFSGSSWDTTGYILNRNLMPRAGTIDRFAVDLADPVPAGETLEVAIRNSAGALVETITLTEGETSSPITTVNVPFSVEDRIGMNANPSWASSTTLTFGIRVTHDEDGVSFMCSPGKRDLPQPNLTRYGPPAQSSGVVYVTFNEAKVWGGLTAFQMRDLYVGVDAGSIPVKAITFTMMKDGSATALAVTTPNLSGFGSTVQSNLSDVIEIGLGTYVALRFVTGANTFLGQMLWGCVQYALAADDIVIDDITGVIGPLIWIEWPRLIGAGDGVGLSGGAIGGGGGDVVDPGEVVGGGGGGGGEEGEEDVERFGYRPQMYPEYGMGTVGGRGNGGVTPRLYRVNVLTDNGADAVLQSDGSYRGEYRAALEGRPWAGPRFVVFELSGYIGLHSNLWITNPYMTVAFQTAPAPGVVVRSVDNGTSSEAMHLISTHDVVMQHGRILPGWYTGGAAPSICNSGVQLYPSGHYRVLFDHMTMMWHQDEGIALGGPITDNGARTDATIWRSLIAEGLAFSDGSGACSGGGVSGGHGVGGAAQGVAVIQSVIAHNRERNPWWSSCSGLILNNLIYNWSSVWGIVLSDADPVGFPALLAMSVVGNRMIAGPITGDDAAAYMVYVNALGGGGFEAGSRAGHQIYLSDNTLDQAAFPSVAVTEFANLLTYDPRVGAAPSGAALPTGYTPLDSAADVESFLAAHAGAWPLERLAMETRVFEEIAGRTGTYKSVVSDGGDYPALANNAAVYVLPSNPWDVADDVGRLRIETVSLEPLARLKEPAVVEPAT